MTARRALVLTCAVLCLPAVEGDYFKANGDSDHKFLFVIGAHHSGTSLMNLLYQQHEEVSGLTDTHVPENEGQHLQTIYKSAKMIGGMKGFANHPDAEIGADSPLVTEDNRLELYNSWAKYWNTSATVLLEKSPRHIVMTPFLQELFTKERTFFASIIRHPLGATHYRWGRYPKATRKTCGRDLIEHWLNQYQTLARHFDQLENKIIFQFEHMLKSGAQDRVNDLFEWIGLDSSVEIDVSDAPLPAKPRNLRAAKRYPPLPQSYINVLVEMGLDRERYQKFISHPMRMIPYDEEPLNEIIRKGNEQFFKERRARIEQFRVRKRGRDSYGRRLLMFRGARSHITVHVGSELNWAEEWPIMVDMESQVCKDVIRDLEPQVQRFGYSLVDLTSITQPEAFMGKSDINPW